jgi:hypothetical protein
MHNQTTPFHDRLAQDIQSAAWHKHLDQTEWCFSGGHDRLKSTLFPTSHVGTIAWPDHDGLENLCPTPAAPWVKRRYLTLLHPVTVFRRFDHREIVMSPLREWSNHPLSPTSVYVRLRFLPLLKQIMGYFIRWRLPQDRRRIWIVKVCTGKTWVCYHG